MDSKSKILKSYLDKSDWRVKENSTVDFSTGGLTLHNSGAIVADYWLKEVYPKDVAEAHVNADFHLHDLSFLSAYCAGWSLKDLLTKGLGGVTGKITSAPPKHLSTAVLQMVNFLGIMQNEWAGAQAFSSFDTLLAPFVKAENLSYEKVKQSIQMFVFGANVPSRWGCVDENTEVLTPEGFKKYDQLTEGTEIYTMKNNYLNVQPINKMNIYDYDGILHFYSSVAADGMAPMRQLVTTNHRVLFSAPGIDQEISPSINIFEKVSNMHIPCVIVGNNIGGVDYSDEVIVETAAIDISSEEYSWLQVMDRRQALLFIDALGDLTALSFNTKPYIDRLQHIFFIAGISSWVEQDENSNYYLCRGETSDVLVQRTDVVFYKGKVWCPTTDDGIVVFRRDGVIFVSGNSQSPFTNITLDWTVPEDISNDFAIVGGKEQNYTYGSCQNEMDMINKALLEIFLTGDASGRGFQYPILTYNLTKDFDWNHPNTEFLFKITAKYGTPYFQNFINSDLIPSDVRSMCPIGPDEKVLIKHIDEDTALIDFVKVSDLQPDSSYYVYADGAFVHGKFSKYTDKKLKTIQLENGHSLTTTTDHLNIVLDDYASFVNELTTDLLIPGMSLPYSEDMYTKGKGGDYMAGVVIGAAAARSLREMDSAGNITGIIFYNDKKNKLKEIKKYIINTFKLTDHLKIEKTDLTSIPYKLTVSFSKIPQVRLFLSTYIENFFEEDMFLKAVVLEKSVQFRAGILDGVFYTKIRKSLKSITSRKYPYNVLVKTKLRQQKEGCEKLYCNATFAEILNVIAVTLGFYLNTEGPCLVHKTDCCVFPANVSAKNNDFHFSLTTPKDKLFNTLLKNQFTWVKIVSIEDAPGSVGYCFDVEQSSPPHFTVASSGVVTHNCRLQLDKRELLKRGGGLFGSAEFTGSIGVVTLNLPRLGYLSKDKDDFYERLAKLMDIAAKSLDIKRKKVTELYNLGLYPYTKHYLPNFDNHFSTIGLIGMNECTLNARWIQQPLSDPSAYTFAVEVLDFMRNRLQDYQEMYGSLYNLEATPAESTSYRLAMHDRKVYKNIITAGVDNSYYTNSSNFEVDFNSNIFEVLDGQEELQQKYTGGTVVHVFLGEQIESWQTARNFVKKIAENYRIPYFTLSPTYSICSDHGYIAGEKELCPYCGKTTEVYSRITGYYRPVSNWNDGKQEEFKQRVTYEKPAI